MTPVLVADQDDRSRNRLAEVLSGEGFAPLPARTGAEAIEVARSRVVPITILDVLLPDLSGIETFELISSVRGRVHGIFLARDRDKETLVRLLDVGAYTVLNKPPRMDWLIEALRELRTRVEREDKQTPS
ncbi:MAG: response regulator [Planctomycetota bacterium]|nr:response regulator [Planctomycetota bacterium]